MMETRYLLGLPFITIPCEQMNIEAILDTGFNGALLLPKNIIRQLHLQRIGIAQYTMADGTLSDTEIFTAEILWLQKKKHVAVVAAQADLALLGMELLQSAKTTLHPLKHVLSVEAG